MSPQSHRQLCLALLVWLAAVALILRAMGPSSPLRLDPLIPSPPQPTLASLPEPKPPEPKEPEPIKDELAEFEPCAALAKAKDGAIYFDPFRYHYDDKGRFVLLASYAGIIGDLYFRENLKPPRPVTALDFNGSHKIATRRLAVAAEGPVTAVLWGQHRGFTRLSVNYDPLKPPQTAALEVLCRPKQGGGLFAVRLTFDPLAPKALALAFGG